MTLKSKIKELDSAIQSESNRYSKQFKRNSQSKELEEIKKEELSSAPIAPKEVETKDIENLSPDEAMDYRMVHNGKMVQLWKKLNTVDGKIRKLAKKLGNSKSPKAEKTEDLDLLVAKKQSFFQQIKRLELKNKKLKKKTASLDDTTRATENIDSEELVKVLKKQDSAYDVINHPQKYGVVNAVVAAKKMKHKIVRIYRGEDSLIHVRRSQSKGLREEVTTNFDNKTLVQKKLTESMSEESRELTMSVDQKTISVLKEELFTQNGVNKAKLPFFPGTKGKTYTKIETSENEVLLKSKKKSGYIFHVKEEPSREVGK